VKRLALHLRIGLYLAKNGPARSSIKQSDSINNPTAASLVFYQNGDVGITQATLQYTFQAPARTNNYRLHLPLGNV
jgi:hypothetical protein